MDTEDFEAVNAAAFLLSTESSKTIFIAVKDDDLPEADETFTFNLKLQVGLGPPFGILKSWWSKIYRCILLFLDYADDIPIEVCNHNN